MKTKIMGLSLSIIMLAALVIGCGQGNNNAPASSAGTNSSEQNTEEQNSGEAAQNKEIIIGVTMQDLTNEFIAMLKDTMIVRSEKYPNLKLITNDGEGKPEKQILQMETFVSQKVNAIIINPRDPSALIPSIEAAVKAGIPVITLNTDINKDVGQVWVGAENEQGGEVEAEYIAKKLNGKGTVAVLRGVIGSDPEIKRSKGYKSVFDKYPDIKIIFDQSGNWSRDESMSIMENWIQTGRHIDALLGMNDEMALGALKAIEDSGLQGKIIVAGLDALPDALDAVKNGKLDATVFNDSIGQAFTAVDLAMKAVNGEKIERTNIPFELVTKENADKYYDRIKLK